VQPDARGITSHVDETTPGSSAVKTRPARPGTRDPAFATRRRETARRFQPGWCKRPITIPFSRLRQCGWHSRQIQARTRRTFQLGS
jgi:hypothetical protein